MDFGKVITRAWQITWKWKVLWILGFLAALGQSNGPQTNYSFTGGDLERYSYQFGDSGRELLGLVSGLLIGFICLVILIVIILWVISVIARGGLIAGVQQVEEQGSTSFRKAWSGGGRKFWTLFGIGVLAGLPALILVIVGLIVISLGIFAGVNLLDISEAAGIPLITFVVLVCGGSLCCGLIVLIIVLEQIRIYAERAAIIEDLDWIQAFKRGWEVLTDNLGATIVLWLIFFALGILVFGISLGLMFAIMAPLFSLFAFNEPGWWIVGPMCLGGLIGTLIFALIRSIIMTFTSATWTLAYREMTSISGHPVLDNLEIIEEA